MGRAWSRTFMHLTFVAGLVGTVAGLVTDIYVLTVLGCWAVGVPVTMNMLGPPLTAKERARGKEIPAMPVPEEDYVSCTCGSKMLAVPVEVVYDAEEGPEVVAHLCPECRERRTPKQIRVEAAQALDRARAMRAALALKPVATEDLDRDRAKVALFERIEPSPPLEIEQGDWVYSIGWHNADDLCDEDAHEWESVSAHGVALPLRQFCAECRVSRRPTTSALNEAAALTGPEFWFSRGPCRYCHQPEHAYDGTHNYQPPRPPDLDSERVRH